MPVQDRLKTDVGRHLFQDLDVFFTCYRHYLCYNCLVIAVERGISSIFSIFIESD